MGKFIKPGKVVILLAGRYAGKKAIVIKTYDDGTKEHEFSHALVAGIEKPAKKVRKYHSEEKVLNRSHIKPFIKIVNYNHIMPTRYAVTDLDLKQIVKPEVVGNRDQVQEAKKELKKVLENRYLNRGKNTAGLTFFYSKLRF